MPSTVKKLAGPAYLASSVANVYVPGTNLYGTIKHIHVANKDTSARTFSLYLGATGGSAGGTELFKDKSVAVGDAVDLYCNLRVSTTDFLSGVASAASALVITVTGEENAV